MQTYYRVWAHYDLGATLEEMRSQGFILHVCLFTFIYLKGRHLLPSQHTHTQFSQAKVRKQELHLGLHMSDRILVPETPSITLWVY